MKDSVNILWMSVMKNLMESTLLALFLALILFIQSVILLHACLIWPAKENNTNSNSVFYMGVVIFVTCTTLPFALITGYMVIIDT